MKRAVRSNILSSLLSVGYFPKELPPVFTTVNFGMHADAIISEWKRLHLFGVKPAKKFPKVNGRFYRARYSYERVPSADPESLSKPKRLYERRNIHITHPVPQALLVAEVAEHWPQIQKWLSRQHYSEDEIVVAEKYDRAVKGINFRVHKAKKNYLEATSDWLVKTDITRFYPSIYTHSIAWAAYGKERVKRNLKTYDGSLADRLDLLVRSCNRNQTVGLPIGPESSRIIAEIISSRIDADFASICPNVSVHLVDRLQDDWTVGASSLDEAQNILSVISECYRGYGLEINGSKTSVTHLMSSEQGGWRSEIIAFLSHRSGPLFGSRLQEFLALCLKLQIANPSEVVLNYALSIVEGRRIRDNDLETIESFLLKAAALSPISMDRICRIIINLNISMGGLSKNRLRNRFVQLAERHFSNGALFEVIWLLYTLRGIKVPFHSKKIAELAERVPSSAVRLLLLDMHNKGLVITALPKESWESDITCDRILTDWSWLYAYEAVRRGWLNGPKNLLATPLFKPMHDRDVTFYDPSRNIKRSSAVKRAASTVRKAEEIEVNDLIKILRKISFNRDLEADY